MKNLLLFGIVFTFLLTSCSKKPLADFSTDKSTYTAGDVVKLTNSTIDGNSYKWTLPDGQTSASENLDYILDPSQPDATLSFKLEAFSKNGKESDQAIKSITVKAAYGTATIWTSNSNVSPINVYIDNTFAGTITSSYSIVPACGSIGCVTANLKVGTHIVSGSDGNYTWSGTINILRDGCSTLVLQ